MQLKLVALVIVAFSALTQTVLAENMAVKATTPVQVSIYPETSVAPGSVSTFVIRASSMLPSQNFIVEVAPAPGSIWISGQQQWQGSIMPDEVKEFRITVQLPTEGVPAISVTASIPADDGNQLAANAEYRQQPASVMASQKLKSIRNVSRNGRQVVEYKIR